MDVSEAIELIRAARPDLKKIIRVPEVGRLTLVPTTCTLKPYLQPATININVAIAKPPSA